MNHDRVWRIQRGHIFHAQCWDRVAHAHVDRQLAGNLEGSAPEAPCAICRGVGLITAEIHYALAGDQESLDHHEGILRGANELRDLREELNRVTAMMTGNAVVSTTTPARQPASSANAGLVMEASAPAGTPAVDTPMPLVAETANKAGAPAPSAPPAVP
eukprot:4554509-Pyramimonas_sp.AAC.1